MLYKTLMPYSIFELSFWVKNGANIKLLQEIEWTGTSNFEQDVKNFCDHMYQKSDRIRTLEEILMKYKIKFYLYWFARESDKFNKSSCFKLLKKTDLDLCKYYPENDIMCVFER